MFSFSADSVVIVAVRARSLESYAHVSREFLDVCSMHIIDFDSRIKESSWGDLLNLISQWIQCMHGDSTQWTCREKAHIIFLIQKHTALLCCVHQAERSSSFSQSRILEKWKLFSVSPKRQRRHNIEHIHDMCAPRRYQRLRLFFLRFRISTELWGWACERVRSQIALPTVTRVSAEPNDQLGAAHSEAEILS